MEKLQLIGCREEDFETYYNIRSSKGDVYWNGYKERPEKESFRKIYYTRLSTSPFEKAEDRRNYFIRVYSELSLCDVGFVQLIKHEDNVEIGYTVLEEYQGHGYATKALYEGILLAKKFSNNIIVRIRDDNVASQKVALKNGFSSTSETQVMQYPNIDHEVILRTFRLDCCDCPLYR